MIRGVGVDIIEVERVRDALARRPRLLHRLFTEEEIAYCRSKPASEYAHLAGRFAAKEAVAKALGRSLSWQEVAVHNTPSGKPVVVLKGRAREALADRKIMLSISHSRNYAVAYAVLCDAEDGMDEGECEEGKGER